MRLFAARFNGTCGACFESVEPGDSVTYSPDGLLVCEDCHFCEAPATFNVSDRRQFNDGEPVMPRGRTAADRCGRCFQVPASNGRCGCE